LKRDKGDKGDSTETKRYLYKWDAPRESNRGNDRSDSMKYLIYPVISLFLPTVFVGKSTLWGTIAHQKNFLIYRHIKDNSKKGEFYHAILVKNYLEACSDG
jgi:hypothetical protein